MLCGEMLRQGDTLQSWLGWAQVAGSLCVPANIIKFYSGGILTGITRGLVIIHYMVILYI